MTSIFKKIKEALASSTNKIASGIDNIFYKKKLDNNTIVELEELLISNDISYTVATEITNELRKQKFDQEVSSDEIKKALSQIITNILEKNLKIFLLDENSLNVILMCGVNGNGKTTTIGKLSKFFINQGKKVGIAACDTFRAAAVEQLEKWAIRSGAVFYKGIINQDPASVAFSAVQEAQKDSIDVLFIDTAGRLQNYKNLMDELKKIVKVIRKADSDALKYSLLVIDATTGQNAYSQVEEFKNIADINGLIITKLDGSSKAGAVIAIVQKYQLPIYFIGVGEKEDDLKEFDPIRFSRNLVGLDLKS